MKILIPLRVWIMLVILLPEQVCSMRQALRNMLGFGRRPNGGFDQGEVELASTSGSSLGEYYDPSSGTSELMKSILLCSVGFESEKRWIKSEAEKQEDESISDTSTATQHIPVSDYLPFWAKIDMNDFPLDCVVFFINAYIQAFHFFLFDIPPGEIVYGTCDPQGKQQNQDSIQPLFHNMVMQFAFVFVASYTHTLWEFHQQESLESPNPDISALPQSLSPYDEELELLVSSALLLAQQEEPNAGLVVEQEKKNILGTYFEPLEYMKTHFMAHCEKLTSRSDTFEHETKIFIEAVEYETYDLFMRGDMKECDKQPSGDKDLRCPVKMFLKKQYERLEKIEKTSFEAGLPYSHCADSMPNPTGIVEAKNTILFPCIEVVNSEEDNIGCLTSDTFFPQLNLHSKKTISPEEKEKDETFKTDYMFFGDGWKMKDEVIQILKEHYGDDDKVFNPEDIWSPPPSDGSTQSGKSMRDISRCAPKRLTAEVEKNVQSPDGNHRTALSIISWDPCERSTNACEDGHKLAEICKFKDGKCSLTPTPKPGYEYQSAVQVELIRGASERSKGNKPHSETYKEIHYEVAETIEKMLAP